MFDNDYRITALPLSLKWARNRLEQFLASCGLRLDTVDYYAIVTAGDSEEILGGAGIEGNVVKCVAVTDALRGTGMMQRLISHIINHAASQGVTGVKVYTKPENEDIFSSLGFCKLATSPKAILMENGMQGLNDYCRYLRSLHHPGYNGLIVMNANPFTQGHLALVEHASKQVDTLYVVVVKEDKSLFSYEERLAMVSAGCAGFDNVVVCEGSDYAISSATFPTYFLKEVSDATDTQITLDLDLCAQHIAPAVGTKVRFVGSEPTDAVTARYVALMQELLPPKGVRVDVMERIGHNGHVVSATGVRNGLKAGSLAQSSQNVPATTLPYVLAHLACDALQQELDTTPKPGLVDREGSGAHTDMDYALMAKSISTLRRWFSLMAKYGLEHEQTDAAALRQMGLDAEKDMLTCTGGVNTHRGAIFSMGLAVVAAMQAWRDFDLTEVSMMSRISQVAHKLHQSTGTHGDAVNQAHGTKGALAMAQDGYADLFSNWLPFYETLKSNEWQNQRTLLRIIASLDDTNVVHRAGADAARMVKQEAFELNEHFDEPSYRTFCQKMTNLNVSPGGAADMLALTIFIYSIFH